MATKVSFKELNKLALPAIAAGIAEPLISLTDIAVVGNMEQHAVEALAAAGIVGSFLSAIIWVVAQLQTAISSKVSQHVGMKRLKVVKTLVPQTILFSLLLSLVIFSVTSLFAETIFSWYNAEGLILDYAVEYYRIRAYGYPLTLVTFTLFGVFRGLQNTSWAMWCSITGGLINVGLDIVLVYGVGHFIPALHLAGAAYASVIAQGVILLMALYFYFTKTPFNLYLGKRINPNLKPLLLMSADFFLRTLTLNVAIYLANTYATSYGGSYIAAQSILMNIWLFFSFFIDGYADAGNAIGGRLLGAKEYDKLWNLGIDSTRYAIVIALILIGGCLLFYPKIGSLFNQNHQVLMLFSGVFWLVLLMQPINAVAFVFDGIFKGLGEAQYLRNTVLIATFLGFVPTLLVTDYLGWKLQGIWLAFAVWMLIRGGALVYRFRVKYLVSYKK